MRLIEFSKMVATGNDFVVVDNRRLRLDAHRSLVAKKLCDRRRGVGADGLMLLERSKCADFNMRIFNPDGSEPGMCGNGSRCIALYARAHNIASSNMSIETKAGLLSAKVRSRLVKINMTDPKDIRLCIDLEIGKKTYQAHYIDTGVPQVVCFVDDIEKIDVFKKGKSIRYHRAFKPYGANVNFVQTKGKNSLLVRTYERGVEGETLACGTGSVASAVISNIIKGFNSPVKIHTHGGALCIYFKVKKDKFSGVFLEGEAEEVFKGKIKV